MKLMLVCNAGMSTSMLVSKIERAAKDQGIELEVAAFPLTQAEKAINDWDVVMLGPQVRHCLPQLKKATDKTSIEVIDMERLWAYEWGKCFKESIRNCRK